MKGIILAGGSGSRLYPLTKITNKHLLPVYNKPMIYYPIETLVKAGIKDIIIISGKGHAGQFLEMLGSGEEFGANFSYAIQEDAGGIAQALSLAKNFIGNEKMIVFLGDNILEDNLSEAIKEFGETTMGAKIFLKKVNNPSSYGVAKLNNEKIETIVEKPRQFISNLAVTGVYMYDNQVWDIIKNLKPSNRGELEITDVNNFYIKQDTMKYKILNGYWIDCGESIDAWLDSCNTIANGGKTTTLISENDEEKIREITEEIINKTLGIVEKTINKTSNNQKQINDENKKIQNITKNIPEIKKPEILNNLENKENEEEKENINIKKSPYKKAYETESLTLEKIVQNEDQEYTGNPFDINNYYSK